jgi:hypothetical protein
MPLSLLIFLSAFSSLFSVTENYFRIIVVDTGSIPNLKRQSEGCSIILCMCVVDKILEGNIVTVPT